ncbi:MAG: AAA family ATPase [Ignavibacteria bacterium]|nr:AAA family ATPase [Ignavibacteria bacterium]
MPLILNGTRQVGKTYSLKEFGNTGFSQMVYINLENNLAVISFFEGDLNPVRIIQYLETVSNTRIIPESTLIVLDEIQSCPRALKALKVFSKEAPQYYIVAAGSLLGMAVNREKCSFPVGKVDELQMFPMDFEEFLWANQNEMLSEMIRHHFENNEPLIEAFHIQAIEIFKHYLIVGGMPGVVNEFITTQSLLTSTEIQGRILNEYVADMVKYATVATSVKIRASFQSIPVQLAKENKKIKYQKVQSICFFQEFY